MGSRSAYETRGRWRGQRRGCRGCSAGASVEPCEAPAVSNKVGGAIWSALETGAQNTLVPIFLGLSKLGLLFAKQFALLENEKPGV